MLSFRPRTWTKTNALHLTLRLILSPWEFSYLSSAWWATISFKFQPINDWYFLCISGSHDSSWHSAIAGICQCSKWRRTRTTTYKPISKITQSSSSLQFGKWRPAGRVRPQIGSARGYKLTISSWTEEKGRKCPWVCMNLPFPFYWPTHGRTDGQTDKASQWVTSL